MLRNILLSLALLSALLASPAFAADTRVEMPAFDGGRAALTFSANPLYAMTEVPFAIELHDAKGQSIDKAMVSISLDMPAMPMPKNTPAARWLMGAYRGKAIFTMAGAWQAFVDVRIPDGPQEVLVFDINEVLIK